MNPSQPQTQTKTVEQVEAEYSALTSAFKVAARILAIRLFLFLSLVGSFALAVVATNNQNPQSAYVLFLYACVTTLPLSILELRNRPSGG